MNASELVFVDVDTQNDFCAPDGSLFVTGSPNDAFRRLTALAVSRGIPIVGSVDTHDFDDVEFDTFPPHCVKGTTGWLKVAGTLPTNSLIVGTSGPAVAAELNSGAVAAVFFEKTTFDLFSNPRVDGLLSVLGSRRTAVVWGVATDYCVRAAALGLRKRGFKVAVVSDAIAGVTPEGTATAITEMKVAGCQFITEAELVDALASEAA